ncbi:MAG: HAD-IIIA family hydrolase [Lewinellaceae bacterium]|nr:HAD-IIIA family hydrolase [Saprospiraceae bacterium]MCB9330242.1 HAD-IIIA family hydrolase [Lewinellaceae bacterium]
MERQPIIPDNPLPVSSPESSLELVHLFDKFQAVRAFIFDVDGVFTDNSVLVTENGEQLRTMSIRDGVGVKIALQNGFPICIITGGRSQGVIKRLSGLGIEHIYSGVEDKWPVFTQFLSTFGLKASEICYMGDDLPDLQILHKVGLSTCPANAVAEIRSIVDYCSPLNGGAGCIRDILEKVLKTQDKWKM